MIIDLGDLGGNQNLILFIGIYLGIFVITLWLALIIWAYRDMKARSRDVFARVLVAVFVAILHVPGLIIYLLLRPKETIAEAYERSLEEEALLQEIEAKPTCPGCGQHVHTDWQACPHCHTRLKKPCSHCNKLLDFAWEICPHCASRQHMYQPDEDTVRSSRHIQRQSEAESDPWSASATGG